MRLRRRQMPLDIRFVGLKNCSVRHQVISRASSRAASTAKRRNKPTSAAVSSLRLWAQAPSTRSTMPA